MPLIVETGSGLVNADTYLSDADFTAYCIARGRDTSTSTLTARENALRNATDYINTIGRYKGSRLTDAQALEFPRSGLFDWDNRPVTGVPKRVRDATAELAFRALTAPLLEDLSPAARVKSESVGPISVTYQDAPAAQKILAAAILLLQPYFYEVDAATGMPVPGGSTRKNIRPQFGGSTKATFALGMHDDPDAMTSSGD